MVIRLTELNSEPEWDPDRVSGNRSRGTSIVHYCQNTIGYSSWSLTSRFRSWLLIVMRSRSFLFLPGGEALRLYAANHALLNVISTTVCPAPPATLERRAAIRHRPPSRSDHVRCSGRPENRGALTNRARVPRFALNCRRSIHPPAPTLRNERENPTLIQLRLDFFMAGAAEVREGTGRSMATRTRRKKVQLILNGKVAGNDALRTAVVRQRAVGHSIKVLATREKGDARRCVAEA